MTWVFNTKASCVSVYFPLDRDYVVLVSALVTAPFITLLSNQPLSFLVFQNRSHCTSQAFAVAQIFGLVSDS